MASYPVLWPYEVGGIEEERDSEVKFLDHVCWALQYYNW